jgi:predicted ATP-grasp superfamily ATP-dependent carboligase
LDRHLGLKVDYKPLLSKAVQFEGKIKELLDKREKAVKFKERKELTYLG